MFCLCVMALLIAAPPVSAQDFRGRLNGTVTDDTGAILPGVTVTAESPALIQQQVQVTGADGSYRFMALPPGTYTITFELPGFQSMRREGIRVVINQTLTVDMPMQLSTLQETVTVTGESPVVDTSTTTLGTNFTKELLTEIPNARDIWAAMSQSPGMQMTAYDVGGSRTGVQTGFRTYGFDTQNQTKLEGIDTTEGTAANAGYFDFGSFEEFQIGGAGNSAESFAGGASMSISVKSGGDRLTGNWYSDWQGAGTITDNVPDYLKTSNTPNEDGFFVRTALRRGNPIDRQYDINFNLGGPIYRGKAWFFTSWRLNDQYKVIFGADELARSKLSNKYTFKGTWQVTRNNQFVGFLNKREKLQDLRGLGPTTPVSASWYQSSRNYPWKFQWTSVMGSRAFVDVLAGNWYNFFPLRPTRDFGLYDGPWGPGRIDTASNQRFDGGGRDSYQDQKRYKPQVYVNFSYFLDGYGGSHDLKVGYDWKRDRRALFNDQPFDVFYRDTNGVTNQVDLYNTPVTGINDVVYHAAYLSDTWKVTSRLTINLGARIEYYRDGWPDQEFTPNGHPMLAGWNNPVYQAFVAPQRVEARTVAESTSFAPRVGFAYDLTGNQKTVLKVFAGKFNFNSADTLANLENPVGRAQLRYVFNDLNGNRLLDGPQELGRLVSTVGGAGFVRIDRDLKRPYGSELSANVEHEVTEGLSSRVSYVYKNMRDFWGEIDAVRTPQYTIPFTITDTFGGQTFQTFDRPAGIGSDRVFTNPDGMDADFHTVEVAVNRRFRGNWMLLASAGHTWSSMLHDTTGYGRLTSALAYRPARRLFGDNGIETSTTWNYKIVARYTMPFDVGVSTSWKVQSGEQHGRTISQNFPGDATQTIRVEPVTANRFPTVSILDFRLDKSFQIRGARMTGMVDIFNAMNSNPVTSFRLTTVNYREVLGILDPRIVRLGVRVDF